MRALRPAEVAGLLANDIVAHLATVDASGYPHVTPIWFLWDDGAFRLTSYAGRPHLRRIRSNPRVGLVIDREAGLRADGQRPNRQVRVLGDAELATDRDGIWTARIREKYLDSASASGMAERDLACDRILITVRPNLFIAVAST
ncbi:pyridoxamine 5'-phosphate oxidase family protein [Nocardia sp. NBC_01009]|uniref:pyridoxamine 5'-phosphate oxidase family protein n=1 Tax=Nocardia sp. NBC_01009 TaxID=2975996 RepID=UPI003868492D|nr:pyridoxamine 5'-phosphate oxidase family protein [Nocardia sp. NBC_01009]